MNAQLETALTAQAEQAAIADEFAFFGDALYERAEIDRLGDSPFMPEGRDQPAMPEDRVVFET